MPHIHKDIDYAVVVYIVHDNRVLLVAHKQLGMWLPIGGHVELHETPEEALFRETKEESGLDITVLSEKPATHFSDRTMLYAPAYLDVHDISDEHRHIGMVYFARAHNDTVQLAEEEHDDIRWFTDEELSGPEHHISDGVQFYAREALRRAARDT